MKILKMHSMYGRKKEELVARIIVLERINELQAKAMRKAGLEVPHEDVVKATQL